MKLLIAASVFFCTFAMAETKKCSPENLEILARGYKQILASMVAASLSQDKAMIKILKEKKDRRDPEVIKELSISNSFANARPLMEKLTKIETENPECKF